MLQLMLVLMHLCVRWFQQIADATGKWGGDQDWALVTI